MGTLLHLQAHLNGVWHDAAVVELREEKLGHRGASTLDYEIDYWLAQDPDMTGTIAGIQALSTAFPVNMEHHKLPGWPAFLLDMLPQGHARIKLAEVLKLDHSSDACEVPLLLRTAGGPIGNLRVREAWELEQQRIAGERHPGLAMDEITTLDERFLELAAQFAAVASGSSGVQGAWPKVLLTRRRDGRWCPDPMVPDEDATDHVIVKWAGDRQIESQYILAAEAPYLELARAFGIRCARPLTHHDHILVIPRFDRIIQAGGVIRFGQESLVAAAGIAEFGYEAQHEDYIEIIKRVCTDPAAEVTEYVLRDLLNLALGNPDNHGRNTALQKLPDGTVRLTPLFDFCPMRLDPTGVRRSTTWDCMRKAGQISHDLEPDWSVICDVAADGVMPAADLRVRLKAAAPRLAEMPARARDLGVSPEVISRAMPRCAQLAAAIAAIPEEA